MPLALEKGAGGTGGARTVGDLAPAAVLAPEAEWNSPRVQESLRNELRRIADEDTALRAKLQELEARQSKLLARCSLQNAALASSRLELLRMDATTQGEKPVAALALAEADADAGMSPRAMAAAAAELLSEPVGSLKRRIPEVDASSVAPSLLPGAKRARADDERAQAKEAIAQQAAKLEQARRAAHSAGARAKGGASPPTAAELAQAAQAAAAAAGSNKEVDVLAYLNKEGLGWTAQLLLRGEPLAANVALHMVRSVDASGAPKRAGGLNGAPRNGSLMKRGSGSGNLLAAGTKAAAVQALRAQVQAKEKEKERAALRAKVEALEKEKAEAKAAAKLRTEMEAAEKARIERELLVEQERAAKEKAAAEKERLRKEAEAQTRREAEEQARREAEERRLKQEEEERRRKQQEEEERQRKQQEEEERRLAEKARIDRAIATAMVAKRAAAEEEEAKSSPPVADDVVRSAGLRGASTSSYVSPLQQFHGYGTSPRPTESEQLSLSARASTVTLAAAAGSVQLSAQLRHEGHSGAEGGAGRAPLPSLPPGIRAPRALDWLEQVSWTQTTMPAK